MALGVKGTSGGHGPGLAAALPHSLPPPPLGGRHDAQPRLLVRYIPEEALLSCAIFIHMYSLHIALASSMPCGRANALLHGAGLLQAPGSQPACLALLSFGFMAGAMP